ncbi:hypothetical protein [Priestia abyssalis]|nr:hypothetical protein [Priestia abyssalis]
MANIEILVILTLTDRMLELLAEETIVSTEEAKQPYGLAFVAGQ